MYEPYGVVISENVPIKAIMCLNCGDVYRLGKLERELDRSDVPPTFLGHIMTSSILDKKNFKYWRAHPF